ncbi:MAG: hypothetical protein ACOY5R_01205 [Pseudomonadota bacterium]|jgi:hypothetical protein
MANDKRPRGRPKGTGIDDRPVLLQMAELIVAKPTLRPTTALKRIVRRPSESHERRIQAKWRVVGEALCAEVRARAANDRAPVMRGAPLSAVELSRRVAASPVLSAMDALTNNPTMRALRAFEDSPTMRAFRAVQDNPVLRAARALEDSPVMRTARALEDGPVGQAKRLLDSNPSLRMMIELENSPAMRMAREIANNPVLKAAREHADLMRRLGL